MPKPSPFGARVLGEKEHERQQQIKKKSADKYGPRVRGDIDGERDDAPARKIHQEPHREPQRQNRDRTMDEAEAAGQEPAEGPPEEAEREPADDPDAELRRAVVAFVREHSGCPEAAIRRNVTGSTRRIRRAVRELLTDGDLKDRGDGRGKALHMPGPADEGTPETAKETARAQNEGR